MEDRAWLLAQDVPENPDREKYEPYRADLEENFRVVVPWSGGLDSTAALLLAWQEYPGKVIAMPMSFGQPWDNAEARNRSFLIDKLWSAGIRPNFQSTVAMPPAEQVFGHIQVGRNFAIAEWASGFVAATGWGEVWLAWYGGEIPLAWGDKSIAALSLMQNVHLPWRHYTKGDVMAWMIGNGWIEIARQTYSCFAGQNVPCGKCRACWNTFVAWNANGLASSMMMSWLLHADFGEQVSRYRKALAERPSDYGTRRAAELLSAMETWEAIS